MFKLYVFQCVASRDSSGNSERLPSSGGVQGEVHQGLQITLKALGLPVQLEDVRLPA